MRERLDEDDVKLLEKLFILEGIFFDPNSVEDLELAFEDVTMQTISSLQQAVEELVCTVDEVRYKSELQYGSCELELHSLLVCRLWLLMKAS